MKKKERSAKGVDNQKNQEQYLNINVTMILGIFSKHFSDITI